MLRLSRLSQKFEFHFFKSVNFYQRVDGAFLSRLPDVGGDAGVCLRDSAQSPHGLNAPHL